MSRYIDADELTEFYEPYKDMQVPVNALLEQIKDTSTVDVVEVVRCKDCKHKEHCFSMVHMCEKSQRNYINRDIDYCSYGEKKDE